MGNPIRRTESPARTALQVIEAHKLFHLVTVIVHGQAMPCRSNMPSYVMLCLLCPVVQKVLENGTQVKVSLLTKKLLEVQSTDQKKYLSKSKKVVI